MTKEGADELAIRVRGLSKKFVLQQERRYSLKERVVRGKPRGTRDFWALQDVSFDVPRGSFFGMVGHNGSGKSTALKVLAGIYRPTAGYVTVAGRLRAMIELGAGFHPELTGRENIQLNASILGLSQREIRSSMDEIVEFSGIGDFIDVPVKVYSSGMTIRLGFSVAVKMDPEILIVDEVIAVGDEEFQRRCMDHLFALRRGGTTIVLVTHSMAAVEEMCDEAMWLDHGRTRAIGSASQVVREYINSVNEAETAQQLSSTPKHPGDMLADARRGTAEAQVQALQIMNTEGALIDVLIPGQACRLQFTIEAKREVRDCAIAFGIYDEMGTTVAGTQRWTLPESLRPGTSILSFDMSQLLLQPGSYLVSSALTSDGRTVDELDRAFVIKVRNAGDALCVGPVQLPGTWSWARRSAP